MLFRAEIWNGCDSVPGRLLGTLSDEQCSWGHVTANSSVPAKVSLLRAPTAPQVPEGGSHGGRTVEVAGSAILITYDWRKEA